MKYCVKKYFWTGLCKKSLDWHINDLDVRFLIILCVSVIISSKTFMKQTQIMLSPVSYELIPSILMTRQ